MKPLKSRLEKRHLPTPLTTGCTYRGCGLALRAAGLCLALLALHGAGCEGSLDGPGIHITDSAPGPGAGTEASIGDPDLPATTVKINWYSVIADLISRGYLVGPKAGLSKSKTTALGLATEVTHYGSTGVVAEMRITDFRVSAK